MSQPEMAVIREALQRIHRVAIGESDRAYMSIPADPRRDADLILSAALDELEQRRKSHEALVAALREVHAGMACSCRLEKYVGGAAPCQTCRVGAALALAEATP